MSSTPKRTRKDKHALWPTYNSLRLRLNNPNATSYPWYGGLGIKMCERWADPANGFWNFVADMGDRPHFHYLNRRAKDGDYTPENCYWEHRSKMPIGTRRGLKKKPAPVQGKWHRKKYHWRGEDYSLRDLEEKTKVPRHRILARLARGMSLEDAICTPPRKGGRPKVYPDS